MTITAIIVQDPANPVEVQAWLDAHPLTLLKQFFMQSNIFYVVY